MGAAPIADPSKRMKLSQLDYLANPLRTDHPFGKHPLTIYIECYVLPVSLLAESPLQLANVSMACILEIWSPKEMALFSACIC